MVFHFGATWKMLKQMLSWQPKFNRFLQRPLLAHSNVSHFFLKMNLWSYWRYKLLREVKKRSFIFLIITFFFPTFVKKDFFFQDYKEMDSKIFLIIVDVLWYIQINNAYNMNHASRLDEVNQQPTINVSFFASALAGQSEKLFWSVPPRQLF